MLKRRQYPAKLQDYADRLLLVDMQVRKSMGGKDATSASRLEHKIR